jgi:hypothetical protein
MSGALATHLTVSDATQLVIDKREQLLACTRLAGAPRDKLSSDVRVVIHAPMTP